MLILLQILLYKNARICARSTYICVWVWCVHIRVQLNCHTHKHTRTLHNTSSLIGLFWTRIVECSNCIRETYSIKRCVRTHLSLIFSVAAWATAEFPYTLITTHKHHIHVYKYVHSLYLFFKNIKAYICTMSASTMTTMRARTSSFPI